MVKLCDATNFTLCVLLESIDLMLLTLTRQAYKAVGGLGNCLGIANWMDTWNRQVIMLQVRLMHDRLDRLSSMTDYRQATIMYVQLRTQTTYLVVKYIVQIVKLFFRASSSGCIFTVNSLNLCTYVHQGMVCMIILKKLCHLIVYVPYLTVQMPERLFL